MRLNVIESERMLSQKSRDEEMRLPSEPVWILALKKSSSYKTTTENHDVHIMSICWMLNKYVGWLVI